MNSYQMKIRFIVITSAATPDGGMWFGTGGSGAVRYDGQHWLIYSQDDGLAGNVVRPILPLADGTIWFGTFDGVSHCVP
jgi:ligand-binding sensor domain-containing protein